MINLRNLVCLVAVLGFSINCCLADKVVYKTFPKRNIAAEMWSKVDPNATTPPTKLVIDEEREMWVLVPDLPMANAAAPGSSASPQGSIPPATASIQTIPKLKKPSKSKSTSKTKTKIRRQKNRTQTTTMRQALFGGT